MSSDLRMLKESPRRALMALVRLYRLLSGGRPPTCRFEPSCSAYTLAALERHGAAVGTMISVYRVLRCGPWCAGGHDPVPSQAPRVLRFLARDARPASASPSSPTSTSPP